MMDSVLSNCNGKQCIQYQAKNSLYFSLSWAQEKYRCIFVARRLTLIEFELLNFILEILFKVAVEA